MARPLPLVVLSDLHLGTFGCQAKPLFQYLRSINPEMLVLNGDIVDIWQFRKRYFPKSHWKVLKRLIHMAAQGTKIIYIVGNHDEALRRFAPSNLGNVELCNKKILEINGKRIWIFHGDVFDASIHHSKWIAKLGGWGYDFLIRLNTLTNLLLKAMGKPRYSLSAKIKSKVKQALTFIADFEETAIELALEKGYDTVICGHIHQPEKRLVKKPQGQVLYLNSGDWIEHCSALEYDGEDWHLFKYKESDGSETESSEDDIADPANLALLMLNVLA
jgi:UDP-2,3-diacylglucosamine pyrophosphatase LpxH